jgi:cytoskeletal protein CcmA (bactofilin family)
MGLFSNSLKPEVPEETTAAEVTEETVLPEVTAEGEAPKEVVSTYVDEMGIVAPQTTIHGGIITRGHLAVAGTVDGSVKAEGNIMLSGVIKGAINCNNIIIENTKIDCNTSITAKGSVSIKEDASFSGDITCKHISINGTVLGNIKATGNVGLTKTAIVKGNIDAAVLAVEPGAKISGNVQIK